MVLGGSILRTVLAVTATVTMAEFFELKQLPANDLRARFGLESSCDPVITAVGSDPGSNRVSVRVDCRPPAEQVHTEPSRPTGLPR